MDVALRAPRAPGGGTGLRPSAATSGEPPVAVRQDWYPLPDSCPGFNLGELSGELSVSEEGVLYAWGSAERISPWMQAMGPRSRGMPADLESEDASPST